MLELTSHTPLGEIKLPKGNVCVQKLSQHLITLINALITDCI